jgi:hypothetical protein
MAVVGCRGAVGGVDVKGVTGHDPKYTGSLCDCMSSSETRWCAIGSEMDAGREDDDRAMRRLQGPLTIVAVLQCGSCP